MKYWFFNGSDVVGPFTPRELAAEKAFNENSLVCPEAFSDEEDHWQPALSFEDFQSLLSPDGPVPPSLTLEQEMNTLLHETSPLAFEKTNTDNAALQLPKKPAKPGPIEEYFNHIEKEDLGEILGIPDPAENSDMDLAHALEHQLAKTASTRREQQDPAAADEQTVQQLEAEAELPQAQQTHRVATATEVFATKAPLATVPAPQVLPPEQELKTQLPLLPANDFNGMPTADTAPIPQAPAPQPVFSAAQPAFSQPESHLINSTFPAKNETLQQGNDTPAHTAASVPPTLSPSEVAVLRAEQIEVNSVNARLKQTQEMKDFLQTQTTPSAHASVKKRRSFIFLIALGVIFGTLVVLHQLQAKPAPAVTKPQPPAAVSTAEELLPKEEVPPVPPAEPPAEPPVSDQRAQALEIVQNHRLAGKRGTVAAYLNHIYKTQLSQGYTAAWEAQPLHKNTYIVKYRLTKPRKEPIIYVFQADIAKGKLTGALNNISLDLVGKI